MLLTTTRPTPSNKSFQSTLSYSQAVVFLIGLKVLFNIQQDEYTSAASDTAGVAFLISPQNQMPFPEEQGIIVSPGFVTEIAITQARCRYL